MHYALCRPASGRPRTWASTELTRLDARARAEANSKRALCNCRRTQHKAHWETRRHTRGALALAGREEPDADQHGVARPLLVRRAARLGARAVLEHPAHPPSRRAHLAPRPRALQQVCRPHSPRPTPHSFDHTALYSVHVRQRNQSAAHSPHYYRITQRSLVRAVPMISTSSTWTRALPSTLRDASSGQCLGSSRARVCHSRSTRVSADSFHLPLFRSTGLHHSSWDFSSSTSSSLIKCSVVLFEAHSSAFAFLKDIEKAANALIWRALNWKSWELASNRTHLPGIERTCDDKNTLWCPSRLLYGAGGTTRARSAIVLADSIVRAPAFHPLSTLAALPLATCVLTRSILFIHDCRSHFLLLVIKAY